MYIVFRIDFDEKFIGISRNFENHHGSKSGVWIISREKCFLAGILLFREKALVGNHSFRRIRLDCLGTEDIAVPAVDWATLLKLTGVSNVDSVLVDCEGCEYQLDWASVRATTRHAFVDWASTRE